MKKVEEKYYCDMCGKQFPKEKLYDVDTYSVVKSYAYEWGHKELKKPRISKNKMDLCLTCAELGTNIIETTRFYQPSEFDFKE